MRRCRLWRAALELCALCRHRKRLLFVRHCKQCHASSFLVPSFAMGPHERVRDRAGSWTLRENLRLSCDHSCEFHASNRLQDQIERVRDKGRQLDMMGVPEANIDGHAFHTYRSTAGWAVVRLHPCMLFEASACRGLAL